MPWLWFWLPAYAYAYAMINNLKFYFVSCRLHEQHRVIDDGVQRQDEEEAGTRSGLCVSTIERMIVFFL